MCLIVKNKSYATIAMKMVSGVDGKNCNIKDKKNE